MTSLLLKSINITFALSAFRNANINIIRIGLTNIFTCLRLRSHHCRCWALCVRLFYITIVANRSMLHGCCRPNAHYKVLNPFFAHQICTYITFPQMRFNCFTLFARLLPLHSTSSASILWFIVRVNRIMCFASYHHYYEYILFPLLSLSAIINRWFHRKKRQGRWADRLPISWR